jgi:hypothetical protein
MGKTRRAQRILGLAAGVGLFASLVLSQAACGWDPSRPFDRNSPVVNEAIAELDGGDAGSATAILTEYLSTGACSEGSIGTPLLVRARANGGVDLGLSLFKVAEGYGQRFGDEEKDSGLSEAARAARGGDIECARKIVKAIAEDDNVSVELRGRARYIEGNLLFLDAKYKDSVKVYDEALTLTPGMVDAGEQVGRDAAWNRAIALRRIEDQKDASPPDASSQDASNDQQSPDASPPPDGGNGDGGDPGNDGGGKGNDGGGPPDSGKDDNQKDSGKDDNPPPQDAGRPPPQQEPPSSMDERILDKLENAPTVQQEAAKKQAQKRRVRVPFDK